MQHKTKIIFFACTLAHPRSQVLCDEPFNVVSIKTKTVQKTFTAILKSFCKNGKIYFLHVQKKEQDSSLYGQQHFQHSSKLKTGKIQLR